MTLQELKDKVEFRLEPSVLYPDTVSTLKARLKIELYDQAVINNDFNEVTLEELKEELRLILATRLINSIIEE